MGIGDPENGNWVRDNRDERDRGRVGIDGVQSAASHSSRRLRVRWCRARRCHHDHGCRPCSPPCAWSVRISISSFSAAVTSDDRLPARASRMRRHIISSRVLEPAARSCVCRWGLTPMRRECVLPTIQKPARPSPGSKPSRLLPSRVVSGTKCHELRVQLNVASNQPSPKP